MKEREAEFLTTQQLARLWDVSEATIKRWADAGHLRPSRTIGGHRRFALAEVARFQRAHSPDVKAAAKKAVRAKALSQALKADEGDALERFFKAIVTGWSETAVSILLRLYLNKVPLAKILDEMVASTMHRVGEGWREGRMSVADEHLSTRTMMRTLEAASNLLRLEQPGGKSALCCAVEDELHEIPVHCAQILLESEGWRVMNLGANTPFFALAQAVEKHQPQLVCISSTMNLALDRCAREYPQFQSAVEAGGARIVLGGEGFMDQAVRQRFPAALYAENFNQLREFIKAG
ncbi:MAG TPA: B12-binding domain-containing protein [Pyrinomonadaceae bacterium]